MRDWLIKARGERTCKEIAEALHLTESYYWRIEQGLRRPSGLTMEQVVQLAHATGIDPMKAMKEEMEWLKQSSGR